MLAADDSGLSDPFAHVLTSTPVPDHTGESQAGTQNEGSRGQGVLLSKVPRFSPHFGFSRQVTR